jgi:hypothetical protein
MSRGLGAAQRYVLDEVTALRDLERTPDRRGTPRRLGMLFARDLTERRAGHAETTEGEREAIRRAIRTLHDRGLVEVGRMDVDRDEATRDRRRNVRYESWVRLPLDAEEVAAEAAFEAERMARLRKRLGLPGEAADDGAA